MSASTDVNQGLKVMIRQKYTIANTLEPDNNSNGKGAKLGSLTPNIDENNIVHELLKSSADESESLSLKF